MDFKGETDAFPDYPMTSAHAIVDPRSYTAWDELHETLEIMRREYAHARAAVSDAPRTSNAQARNHTLPL
jgi:hypothetical protein